MTKPSSRSSGAQCFCGDHIPLLRSGSIFLSLRSINITSLRDDGLRTSYRTAADRRIHPYNQTITPTKPSSPSQGPSAKSSGTSPIGASVEKPTMRPALSTPHKLSPTINPKATSVPSRSARSGFAAERILRLYQWEITAPTTTAKVADRKLSVCFTDSSGCLLTSFHYLRSLINTTSLDTVPRARANCLPSRDQS